jgi:N-acetylmuramoyl-L-alanine amidase
MAIHVVQDGDSMGSIGEQYGFAWQTLWDLPENAALKTLRQNPNVLRANDQVFVPDQRLKEEPGATARLHTFRVKGIPAKLNLVLQDIEGNPRVGVEYTLSVDDDEFSGVSDDGGLITQVIPPLAKKATLTLPEGETYDFNLGYLDPTDYAKGVQGRLKNLGFYSADIADELDDATRDALRGFQESAGLPVTGEPDKETQDALISAHGS